MKGKLPGKVSRVILRFGLFEQLQKLAAYAPSGYLKEWHADTIRSDISDFIKMKEMGTDISFVFPHVS